ncbi:MAG: VCBS repeat-containing protein [Planctomycetaceae bacterium]|nr:VCBS repeat-containing protein [Planctomycetales bacterium]MCB9926513.1 VCBS repeat-containing protein [Planctomycetaceae bacterium]
MVQLTPDATAKIGSVSGAASQLFPHDSALHVIRGLGLPGMLLVGSEMNALATMRALGDRSDIASFELDSAVAAQSLPNDPRFNELIGLENTGQSGGVADADIDAPAAWDIETGSRDFVIAVLDTGLDLTHPDLLANVWTNPGEIAGDGIDNDGNGFTDDVHGYDFHNGDADPTDDHGHGTHVTGTIAAVGNNGLGTTGVAQVASIMVLKSLDAQNRGFTSSHVAALNYVTMMRQEEGVDVRLVNASWGTDPSLFLEAAIAASAEAGILIVAAAGNGNGTDLGRGIDLDQDADRDGSPDLPFYPASYPSSNIISVAATTPHDALLYQSNFGLKSVDLAAPGAGILSTERGGLYGSRNGTSMAVPHVTGTAALVWSHLPDATALEVRAAILEGVDKLDSLTGKVATGGRLNAHGALLVDTYSPRVELVDAPDVSVADGTSYEFAVSVRDNVAVDVDSFDDFDIAVRLVDGPVFQGLARFKSATPSTDGSPIEVVYELTPPGGAWDSADNGTYEISVQPNQLRDTSGNAARDEVLGTFAVQTPLSGPFQVDSTADTVDIDPGDKLCGDAAGQCTLRAAVMESNALPGIDTILLPPGTFTLTVFGTADDSAGDLDITENLKIIGSGAGATILDGGRGDRLFDISSVVTEAEFSQLTIHNGVAQDGGGLRSAGTVTLKNVTVDSNEATVEGGGIFSSGTGTLTLIDTTISTNVSAGVGGGLRITSGRLNITNTTVLGNESATSGGGLHASQTPVTIVNSTFSGNTAGTTGGAIRLASGSIDVTNATLTNNTSAEEGGGLFVASGNADVRNTIIAGNTSTGTDDDDVSGAFRSQGNNFIGVADGSAGFSTTKNDLLGNTSSPLDPQLDPLAANGGPTQTHSPQVSSPVIDAANGVFAPATDQRGHARPEDGNDSGQALPDIGAFEFVLFGEIHGVKFHDVNNNHLRDPGEPALPGWTIFLDANQNRVLDGGERSTVTDAGGAYSFTRLLPGQEYHVTEVVKPGWIPTVPEVPQNQTPQIIAPQTAVATAGVPLIFSAENGNQLVVSDPDAGNSIVAVHLEAEFSAQLTLATTDSLSIAVSDGDGMDINGTIDDINAALDGLMLVANPEAVDGGVLILDIYDLGNTGTGGGLSKIAFVDISVTQPTNQSPVNSVPPVQTTNEDVELIFSTNNGNAISVADGDAGDERVEVSIAVTNGVVTLSTVTGVTVTEGDGTDDSRMTVVGTIDAINAALEELQFTPTPNYHGDAMIELNTSDLGHSGTGGALTDTDQITIIIASQYDPPVAVDDSLATANTTPAEMLDVLLNDLVDSTFASSLTITSATTSQAGSTATIVDGKWIRYTPPAGMVGTDVVSYAITDANGGMSNGQAIVDVFVPSTHQNPAHRLDTNDDGFFSAIDVLQVINPINESGTAVVKLTGASSGPPFTDIDGDGFVTVRDMLLILNELDREGSSVAQDRILERTAGGPVGIRLGVQNQAGTPISSIAVGETFVLAGYVQDLRSDFGAAVDRRGVFASYIDIAYDDGLASLLNPTSITFRPPYQNAPAFDVTTQGLIQGIGAAQTGNAPLGVTEFAVFEIEMKANAVGLASFSSSLADLPGGALLVFGTDTPVSEGPIKFIDASIEILPRGQLARPDVLVVSQGTSDNLLDVLANDHDPNGGSLTITAIDTAATTGAASLVSGDLRYTPPQAFFGKDTLTYTISDGMGGTETTTVTVLVLRSADDPPLPHVITVRPGDIHRDVDFGDYPLPGAISGRVFQDLDGDGDLSGSDVGLEGWTLFLDRDRNGSRDIDDPVAVTAVDGAYAFPNLPSEKSYSVFVEVRDGWVPTTLQPDTDAQGFQVLPANFALDIRSADIDLDGDNDLLAISLDSNQVWTYLNNGIGVFSSPTTYLTGGRPLSMVVADFDGNGSADVLTANSSSGTVSFLRNTNTGSFIPAVNTSPQLSDVRGVASGDLDADGDVDIVVTGAGGSVIMQNDGDGNFSRAEFVEAGQDADSAISDIFRSAVVADLNKDGRLDIAMAGFRGLYVSLNQGLGAFGSSFPVSSTAHNSALAAGDMDNDGDIDLITHNVTSFEVRLNDGAGNFPTAKFFDGQYEYLDVADIDGDGTLDLITDVGIYANQRGNVLGGGLTSFASHSNARPAIADFEGDGQVDVARATEQDIITVFNSAPIRLGAIGVRVAADTTAALDFGNQLLRSSIQGYKFNDLNGNGVHDENEQGLAHWNVFLDLNKNGIPESGEPTVETDNKGYYEFTDLEPIVTYHVAELTLPSQSAWEQTYPVLAEGDVTVTPFSVDSQLRTVFDIATDGENGFFLTGLDGIGQGVGSQEIFQIGTNGGAANVVSSADRPAQIAAAGGFVYWIDPTADQGTTAISRFDIATGEVTRVYRGIAQGQTIASGVGLDTVQSTGELAVLDAVQGRVFTTAASASQPVQVGPARYDGFFDRAHPSFVDEENGVLYIADPGLPGFADTPPRIQSIAIAGGEFTELYAPVGLDADAFSPQGIAVHEGTIYLTNGSELLQMPITGGVPSRLAADPRWGSLRGLTYLDGALYVVDNGDGTEATIWRVELNAPAPITAEGAWIVTPQPGKTVANIDFGNHNASTSGGASGTGQIRGRLFDDQNANGTQDPGEPGIAGRTVFIDANRNGILDPGEPFDQTLDDDSETSNVDEKGDYGFTNLVAGPHVITEQLPFGWEQTTPRNLRFESASQKPSEQSQVAAFIDIDHDGDLDLAITQSSVNKIELLINNGAAEFQSVASLQSDLSPVDILSADLNGDGFDDLATANVANNSVSVFLSNEQGLLASPVHITLGATPVSIAAADLNGDGAIDLVTANDLQDSVSVLLNHGDGSFAAAFHRAVGRGPSNVILVDIDANGSPDIITANVDSNDVTVLKSDGTGGFLGPESIPAGAGAFGITSGDFDRDGAVDLAVTNLKSNKITILRNNSGDYTIQSELSAGQGPTAITAADFNEDGFLDLAVSTIQSANVSILLNNGNGTFGGATSAGVLAFPDFFAFAVEAADLDGDGDQDLVSANGLLSEVMVFRNVLATGPQIVRLNDGETATEINLGSRVAGAAPSIAAATESVTLDEDFGQFTLALRDIRPGGGELRPVAVSVTPSDSTLFAQIRVNYASPNTQGSVDLTSARDMAGSSDLIVTITDGGLDGNLNTTIDNQITSKTISITVLAKNDAPTLDAIEDRSIDEDADEQLIDLSGITAGGGEDQTLRLTASSDNQSLIPDLQITYTSSDATGSLVFTPRTDASGVAVITVTVTDAGLDGDISNTLDNATSQRSFTVTVNAVNDAPTAIALSSNTIAENSDTTFPISIGELTATDVDEGDSHMFTLVTGLGDADNSRFRIDGDRLQLKPNEVVNFEAQSSYAVRVNVFDGLNNVEQSLTVSVTDVNESPTSVSLSNNSVAENTDTTNPALIGTLSANDVDAGDMHMFRLVAGTGDTDNGKFRIDGNELQVRAGTDLDHESQSSYSVRVQAIDTGGLMVQRMLTIVVTDVNEAPTSLLLSNNRINESADTSSGPVTVGTLSALDETPSASLAYTLVMGAGDADNAAFQITGNALQFRQGTALDFESQMSYSVLVRVDDGEFSLDRVFAIALTNQNEAPTDVQLSPATVDENVDTSADLPVGQLSAADDSPSSEHVFALVAGAGDGDNSLFTVAGNVLHLSAGAALDFETRPQYFVRLQVTDGGGLSFSKALAIQVRNVNEPPESLSLDNLTVTENTDTAGGLLVSTITVSDPDAGDRHLLSLVAGLGDADNGVFEVRNDNELYIRAGASLNHELQPIYTIRLAAEDEGGLRHEQTFTVMVTDVNEAPGLPTLSPASIAENTNTASGPVEIGKLSAIDADSGAFANHTFTLVPGGGNADNNKFIISGNKLQLKQNEVIDFEAQASYSVRVNVSDGANDVEQSLTVNVIDVNEYHNQVLPLDVNRNHVIEPLDALIIINRLNSTGPSALVGVIGIPEFAVDTNNDGTVSPIDVLLIINRLNGQNFEGEGIVTASEQFGFLSVAHEGNIISQFFRHMPPGRVAMPTAFAWSGRNWVRDSTVYFGRTATRLPSLRTYRSETMNRELHLLPDELDKTLDDIAADIFIGRSGWT